MDLNRQVIDPITEPTGARAVLGMAVGTVAGTVIAVPVLAVVFGL